MCVYCNDSKISHLEHSIQMTDHMMGIKMRNILGFIYSINTRSLNYITKNKAYEGATIFTLFITFHGIYY